MNFGVRNNRRKCYIWLCALLLIFPLFVLIQNEAYAHRMLVEEVDQGIFSVRYDNGTTADLADITAFDENGNIIMEGEVDEEGYFHYEGRETVHQVTADDGMGHRATWVQDEKENTGIDVIPLWIRALLGISVVIFIASLFYYRESFKRKQNDSSLHS